MRWHVSFLGGVLSIFAVMRLCSFPVEANTNGNYAVLFNPRRLVAPMAGTGIRDPVKMRLEQVAMRRKKGDPRLRGIGRPMTFRQSTTGLKLDVGPDATQTVTQ